MESAEVKAYYLILYGLWSFIVLLKQLVQMTPQSDNIFQLSLSSLDPDPLIN